LKQIAFLILLCSFSYNLHGFEIGTIKLSQIIDSSKEYGNFISNFENIKKKIFDNLNNIENNLNQKKEDIENSKIILSQDEYDKRVNEFNIEANNFQVRVDKINKQIENYLKTNKSILINEVAEIVREISEENNTDIIFNENQYFLSNSKIDLTNLVIERLGNKKIDFSEIDINIE
tara:strand:+ start:494 stop:1021 length:528 start_codon:yes stop_codon:yes gene_type:complete